MTRPTALLALLAAAPWRRLIQAPLVLLVLVSISFFMVRLAPGNPFSRDNQNVPVETIAALEARYGLDQPLGVQYLRFLGNLAQGDLGPSMVNRQDDVAGIIGRYLPLSLALGAVGMLLALGIGIAAGVLAALRRGTLADHGALALVMLGVSVPTFVIAPLLQNVFGLWLGWLPVGGWPGWASPLHLILPALTLAAPFAARIAALTRAGMLEVLSEDFVRTARAKGLRERWVLARHVLRGALLPVVAYLGPAVATVLTGSLVVEKIFGLPGLGQEFITSAINRDYFLVMGTVIVYGSFIIGCNLLADVAQLALDPRQRTPR